MPNLKRVEEAGQQGGLAAMLSQAGGDKELVNAATEIESMPGGPELLYTHLAEEMMKAQGIPKKDAKKVRLFNLGGEVEARDYYAKGGIARAAEKTRKAGRDEDEMLVHMTSDEFDAIKAMWGEPDTNPNTGLPEYGFLKKIWKGVKKGVKKVVKSKIFQMVAPIALSIFVPGLGTAIGMALTGGAFGAGAAAVVGNAVVQGGLGALSGGKKGAIKGAIAGGLGGAAGAYGKGVGESVGLSGKTADVVGSAMIQGAGSELTGGDFTEGAIQGGLGSMTRGSQDQMSKNVRAGLGMKPAEDTALGQYIASQSPQDAAIEMGADEAVMGDPVTEHLEGVGADLDAGAPPPGAAAPPPTAAETPPGLMDLAKQYALPGALALGAATQSGYEQGPPPASRAPESFNEPLPVFNMDRKFQGLQNQADYYTYGQAGSQQSGQHLFTDPDPFPGDSSPLAAAAGATGPQPVQLPPGRAGMAQRRSLEQQGWTYSPGTNSMTPPQSAAGAAGSGSTGFVGQARGGYQEGGEYWEQNEDVPNAIPTVSREGGHHVQGPGSGRSDDIPAYLSDGEYVIDAESVALLGDGSGNAGAQRLDEMRRELRKHKAGKMKTGEFTHKAKKPTAYMNKVKKLRRTAKYEHGGLHNVSGTSAMQPNRPAVGGNA